MAKRQPGQKKLRTREHVIADLSVNYVERQILRCSFSVERIRHDYGVDLLMFTYAENGEIENGHVQFQIKATDRLNLLADGANIALSVAFADVKLWMWEPMPVILVLYDAADEEAYWLYIQRQLEGRDQILLVEDQMQETVTFRIPRSNRLDCTAIHEFRGYRDEVLAYVHSKGVVRHND